MATGVQDGRSNLQPVPEPSHRGAPAPNAQGATSPPSKRELASWWKKFGRKQEKEEEKEPRVPGIFGIPLAESIRYANVAISLTNEKGESFIYGYVPIVVAKCGVFLKEKATDIEGIFRLSGSAKRIKDLQMSFDSPDRYGKGLDWTGYTVHDAANILRRYLNQLPEPIVPLDAYEKFRDPLRSYQSRVDSTQEGHSPDISATEHANSVAAYQKLITELPALNRQLLLYILDLLAVFASKSDLNRMTAANLAAIFQPGILSHPMHDMAPQEYRLSQDVLIFLIENQDNFLIGMSGTAVDEQTQKDVESGVPLVKSPNTAIGRSASNASAGADSLRKFGIRRNVSTSSRASRERGSPNVSSPGTPATPSFAAGAGASGSLGRSNTVPSKRSPAIGSTSRFPRRDSPSGASPATAKPVAEDAAEPAAPQTPTPKVAIPDPATDVPTPSLAPETPVVVQAAPPSSDATGPPATSSPPNPQSKERKISNLFSRSPIFGPSQTQINQGDKQQPRKLQKRQRIPGSANESAHSSSVSFDDGFHTPLVSPTIGTASQADPMATTAGLKANMVPGSALAQSGEPQTKPITTSPANQPQAQGLKPSSPTHSLHSRGSATEQSDLEALDDPNTRPEKRRNRWRFSVSTKKGGDDTPLVPPPPIGQLPGARASSSSFGSAGKPRQSFSLDATSQSLRVATEGSSTGQPSVTGQSTQDLVATDVGKDGETEKKGLFGKWKAKMQQSRDDRKEREAEKERAKSPPRSTTENSSRNSLSAFAAEHLTSRSKSFEKSRENVLPVVSEQPVSETHVEVDPAKTSQQEPLADPITTLVAEATVAASAVPSTREATTSTAEAVRPTGGVEEIPPPLK